MTELDWLKQPPTQQEFIRNCHSIMEAQGVIWALKAAGVQGDFTVEHFKDRLTSGWRDLFTVYRNPPA